MICEPFELQLEDFPRRSVIDIPERSEGVHLTDVIRDIMQETGIALAKGGSMWTPDDLEMAGEIGFMWEEALSSVLKGRLPERLGEIERDGISMSPDGFDFDPWELWEYKATWVSCRRDPCDNFKWMSQVKGYLNYFGPNEAGLYVVKMAVLYINGDYKPPKPKYRGYKITFYPIEVEENWSMVTSHARRKGLIP